MSKIDILVLLNFAKLGLLQSSQNCQDLCAAHVMVECCHLNVRHQKFNFDKRTSLNLHVMA